MICEGPECCGEGGKQAWRRRTWWEKRVCKMLEFLGVPFFNGEDAGQLYARGRPILGASSCNAVVR